MFGLPSYIDAWVEAGPEFGNSTVLNNLMFYFALNWLFKIRKKRFYLRQTEFQTFYTPYKRMLIPFIQVRSIAICRYYTWAKVRAQVYYVEPLCTINRLKKEKPILVHKEMAMNQDASLFLFIGKEEPFMSQKFDFDISSKRFELILSYLVTPTYITQATGRGQNTSLLLKTIAHGSWPGL